MTRDRDRISKSNWSKVFNAGWKRYNRRYEYHKKLHEKGKCPSNCERCDYLARNNKAERLIEVQSK